MRALAAVPVAEVVDDPIRVRAFESGDEARWERFVEGCESATFFHRIGWRAILESVFRHRCHYLLATRAGAVCGVLPLAEVKTRLFGHALVSLPFCVYGGPAANDADTEHALVAAAAELAEALGVDHLELRNRTTKCAGWPRQDLYVTFRKAISADADANLLAIPRKQRAMVRKGIARNLRSEIDETPERFFDLYADNVHRHGTPPLSRRYFAALLDTFGNNCRILTVCTPDGQAVSSVLSFHFRDEVMPYYAGDTSDARALAANDFKYWELMRSAGEAGIRWFDYGRSKRDSGSYDFKRNWGFEPSPLSYEYRLLKRSDVPQNNPANARYSALIAVWRRLPRPLVNAIGPMIVRGLG